MKRLISLALPGVCAFFAASCAPTALLNDEMQQEIAAGHVKKVKLYVDSNGNVEKRSLYLTSNAVPSWVSEFADQTIGKGGSEYYELEWYADVPNLKVYECTRMIRGRKVEVSVNERRQLRYVEREISHGDLPASVKSAVRGLKGFKLVEVEEKRGADFLIYQVEGMQGGAETTYSYDASGALLKTQRTVEAEIEAAF